MVSARAWAECDGGTPSPSTISPTLNRVHPCLCSIVFLYPFLRFFFTNLSIGLFVFSITVNSHRATQLGIASNASSVPATLRSCFPSAAGDRIAYSRDPTSSIRVSARVVPGGWGGESVGTVRTSRGWRRYVRECSLARRYRPEEGVEELRRSRSASSVVVGSDGGA